MCRVCEVGIGRGAQYDEEGRVAQMTSVVMLGGEDGTEMTIMLNFTAAVGLKPWEAAFATASGSMRFSEVSQLCHVCL